MEVFKGEEGEIILNYKRYKGILISKLISKEEINEYYIYNSSDYYPKEEEEINNSKLYNYLEYNEYTQNMFFYSSQTNSQCKNGCYLLLTYYSIYLNNKTKNNKIIGSEFTLLCRILEDEEEDRSQIITIPLNEFIHGKIDKRSFKMHYFSIFIPENTTNLMIDMNFFNIEIYYHGIGVKRFNTDKAYLLKSLLANILWDFNPKIYEVEPFGGNFISIAFTNMIGKQSNYYYFRALPVDSINNNFLLYPLDTNVPCICQTTKIFDKNTCLFIIDNNYKDLQNDFIMYTYGQNKINYVGLAENNESDYYSIDLKDLNFKKIYVKIITHFLKSIIKNIQILIIF